MPTTTRANTDCDEYIFPLSAMWKEIRIYGWMRISKKRGYSETLWLSLKRIMSWTVYTIRILCSKISLDDLKTVEGVWDTTFHEENNHPPDHPMTPVIWLVGWLSFVTSVLKTELIWHSQSSIRRSNVVFLLFCFLRILRIKNNSSIPHYQMSKIAGTFDLLANLGLSLSMDQKQWSKANVFGAFLRPLLPSVPPPLAGWPCTSRGLKTHKQYACIVQSNDKYGHRFNQVIIYLCFHIKGVIRYTSKWKIVYKGK